MLQSKKVKTGGDSLKESIFSSMRTAGEKMSEVNEIFKTSLDKDDMHHVEFVETLKGLGGNDQSAVIEVLQVDVQSLKQGMEDNKQLQQETNQLLQVNQQQTNQLLQENRQLQQQTNQLQQQTNQLQEENKQLQQQTSEHFRLILERLPNPNRTS